jgi:fructose-1,6-bisphosphatase/inositol monophosphatase family enzyme
MVREDLYREDLPIPPGEIHGGRSAATDDVADDIARPGAPGNHHAGGARWVHTPTISGTDRCVTLPPKYTNWFLDVIVARDMHDGSVATYNRSITLAARQAGSIARLMQGRVANEGKADATALPNDDDALRARRAAKTIVDEAVQELLLLAAAEALDAAAIHLDAEEETPAVAWFSDAAERSSATLVIDPVDGTIEYIQGKQSYAVCAGLTSDGLLRSALVYLAGRDQLYSLDDDGRPLIASRAYRDPSPRPLEGPQAPAPKVVYKNGRVEQDVVRRLQSAGFEVRDDTDDQIGAIDAILACVTGEAAAYISHTRQMRDILMGGIVSAVPGGFAVDWRGEDLVWPRGGRVPRAVFGTRSDHRDSIIQCCAEPSVKRA